MACILIVDDNRTSCELMAKLLRGLGHVAVCIYEGGCALDAIHQFKPDLLLLDVRMTGTDGLDVLRQIRGDPDWHALSVVMLSGVRDAAVQAEALSLGASDYIVKGWEWQTLLDRIERHLPGSTPNTEAAG